MGGGEGGGDGDGMISLISKLGLAKQCAFCNSNYKVIN